MGKDMSVLRCNGSICVNHGRLSTLDETAKGFLKYSEAHATNQHTNLNPKAPTPDPQDAHYFLKEFVVHLPFLGGRVLNNGVECVSVQPPDHARRDAPDSCGARGVVQQSELPNDVTWADFLHHLLLWGLSIAVRARRVYVDKALQAAFLNKVQAFSIVTLLDQLHLFGNVPALHRPHNNLHVLLLQAVEEERSAQEILKAFTPGQHPIAPQTAVIDLSPFKHINIHTYIQKFMCKVIYG